MKYCSQCGKELVDEAVVCPNCGCAVQAPVNQQEDKPSTVLNILAFLFPVIGLILTFATFAVTYLIRPIGGMVLGSYADRGGRKAALTLTMMLMMVGTLIMALTNMSGFSPIPGLGISTRALTVRLLGSRKGFTRAILPESVLPEKEEEWISTRCPTRTMARSGS